MSETHKPFWWERDDLRYENGSLALGGQDLAGLADSAGCPIFAYSASRIRANLERLTRALQEQELAFRIFFAMKANRFEPLLTGIKGLGLCGIDACSPGELLLARQCGFAEADISFTATSLSDDDLAVIARHPAVSFNCDSLSVIRRLGERCPGREIGLRINPQTGFGYHDNPLLAYSGQRATKFGIYESEFEEALRLAAQYRLHVVGLHVHGGCGYLTPKLDMLDEMLSALDMFREQVPNLHYVNIGGGLGIPLVEADESLDLARWSGTIAKHFPSGSPALWVEPGDYIVKDAGVLVLRVNMVEKKSETLFIGVNGGFNLHMEPAFYHLPLQPAPCRAPRTDATVEATIAGNINEALDVLAEDIRMPRPEEGDYLAFLNAGGYGSSMSSDHCRRGTFLEYLIS